MLIIYVLRAYIKDCLRRLSAVVQSYARGREEVFGTDLWSAKISSRIGGRQEVFVMQPAKDRIATDGIRFSAAIARIWTWVFKKGEGRIGNTGTQCRVRAPGIVMGNPRF